MSGWTELDQSNTTLQGAATNDRFGRDVTLSNDGQFLAVVSERSNGGRGEVNVFELNSGSWQSRGAAFPTGTTFLDADSRMTAVAMNANGDRVVFGASRHGLDGTTGFGKIAVFDWDGTNWTEVGNVVSTEDTAGRREGLGAAVAMSEDGQRIVVSGRTFSSDAGTGVEVGRILFFEIDNGTLQSFAQSDGIAGDVTDEQFGESVDISADGAYVIASSRADDSSSSKGRTRIYKYNDGTSQYDEQIEIQGSTNSYLGLRCGINGDGDIAFTVSRDDAEIKIYTRGGVDGETWTERTDTWPSAAEASWRTGNSNELIRDVSINKAGDVIAVSASVLGIPLRTFVYKYNSSNTTWELVDAHIQPTTDSFGASVGSNALSETGEFVAMGMPGIVIESQNNRGKAYVYQNSSLAAAEEEEDEGRFVTVKGTGFMTLRGDAKLTIR
jgi:6-phosphogluconolactonase (cycloisomerase 2 family)